MVELKEETLIAYADGELDETTAAEVEAALEQDPVAREVVRQFQEASKLAAEAFDAPMQEEVPERLRKLFEDSDSAEPGSGESEVSERPGSGDLGEGNVADLSQLRAARERKSRTIATADSGQGSFRRFALPLAASVALLIGVGGGIGLSNFSAPSAPDVVAAGTIPSGSALHAALEKTPSLEAVEEVSQDGLTRNRIEPQLTFVAADGRYCREYRVIGQTAAVTQDLTGVACRGGDGAWTQQIAVTQQISGGSDYRPAGKGASPIEDFMSGFMPAAPLEDAAERKLLQSDWR